MLESLRFVILESLRSMLRDQPEEVYARTRLMVDVPSMRARMTETSGTTQLLSGTWRSARDATRRDSCCGCSSPR